MSIKMLVDFHEDFKKTIQTDAEIWRTKDWENEKPRETNIDIGGTIYVRSLWTAEIHVRDSKWLCQPFTSSQLYFIFLQGKAKLLQNVMTEEDT